MPIFEIKKITTMLYNLMRSTSDMQGYFDHCSALWRTWREENWNRVQSGWKTEAAAAAAVATTQQPFITCNITITSTSKMSTTTHFCVRCDKNKVDALTQKIPHVAACTLYTYRIAFVIWLAQVQMLNIWNALNLHWQCFGLCRNF